MPEIRMDLVRNKWVSITSNRALKPNDFPIMKTGSTSASGGFCPFCEGNESYTPPEIAAFGQQQEPNGPGWLLRTIPNKFSAFNMEGDLDEKQSGVFHHCNGLGKHEVVIETPQHDIDFHQLDLQRIEMMVAMFKMRYNELAQDQRLKYITIYKNRGMFGGASLGHSHSQIVCLPFAPAENQGMPQYYKEKGSCLLCAINEQELAVKERIVFEGEHFVVLCPYASRFAYETWAIPKRHSEHFGEINDAEAQELAMIFKKMSQCIAEGLANPSYNFMVNSSPVNTPYEPGYHWFLEFTPRLLVSHGFEISTGVYMNLMAPEDAAPVLRDLFSSVG